jgi:hypothetical protein
VLLGVGAGVALVAAGLVLWLLVGRSDSGAAGDDARAVLAAAGCELTIVAVPGDGSDHSVTDPEAVSPAWNTDPPTGGPHNDAPAFYGAYDEPLNQAQVVHNLEHGAAYIYYGSDVPDATVAQLRGFYDDHRNGTLLAPYPKLGDKIALGAWNASSGDYENDQGVLATCTGFDQAAFAAYFDAFQFKGPERFPADAMAPGQQ